MPRQGGNHNGGSFVGCACMLGYSGYHSLGKKTRVPPRAVLYHLPFGIHKASGVGQNPVGPDNRVDLFPG